MGVSIHDQLVAGVRTGQSLNEGGKGSLGCLGLYVCHVLVWVLPWSLLTTKPPAPVVYHGLGVGAVVVAENFYSGWGLRLEDNNRGAEVEVAVDIFSRKDKSNSSKLTLRCVVFSPRLFASPRPPHALHLQASLPLPLLFLPLPRHLIQFEIATAQPTSRKHSLRVHHPLHPSQLPQILQPNPSPNILRSLGIVDILVRMPKAHFLGHRFRFRHEGVVGCIALFIVGSVFPFPVYAEDGKRIALVCQAESVAAAFAHLLDDVAGDGLEDGGGAES